MELTAVHVEEKVTVKYGIIVNFSVHDLPWLRFLLPVCFLLCYRIYMSAAYVKFSITDFVIPHFYYLIMAALTIA